MTSCVKQKRVVPGRYRHYKGKYYQVYGLAQHSETEEMLVVYRCLYGDHSLWVRPLAMFTETVNHNNQRQQRFSLVEAGSDAQLGDSGTCAR